MAARHIGNVRELRFVNAALLVLAASLLVGGACNFLPETPQVESATIWRDTVKRGDLTIERRGAGQLIENDEGMMLAQIRVPETQSLTLEVGMDAVVDLRVAEVAGSVEAMDDRIVNGTRTVTIAFTEDLPEEALPGMSVDAAIATETLTNVLYVGKPAYGRANSQMGLFVLVEDGRFAERKTVQMGRSSVNLIEITEGLEEGDEIILSDMSRWDVVSRVALR